MTLSWGNGLVRFYLNDSLLKSSSYTLPATNWTAASIFNLGAYEYLTSGGYNSSDDVIDEFSVQELP